MPLSAGNVYVNELSTIISPGSVNTNRWKHHNARRKFVKDLLKDVLRFSGSGPKVPAQLR